MYIKVAINFILDNCAAHADWVLRQAKPLRQIAHILLCEKNEYIRCVNCKLNR